MRLSSCSAASAGRNPATKESEQDASTDDDDWDAGDDEAKPCEIVHLTSPLSPGGGDQLASDRSYRVTAI
jgi:hypothetical protein